MVGKRQGVGKTARAGYEIGVRRTLPFSEEQLWALLLSPEGLRTWLGGPTEIAEGTPFTLANGTSGQINVYKPWSHIRLTWQPAGGATPSTLQVRVRPATRGTTVSFHHEQLGGAAEREAMKEHWEGIIRRRAEMLHGRGGAESAAARQK